jgi:hypothetical protein
MPEEINFTQYKDILSHNKVPAANYCSAPAQHGHDANVVEYEAALRIRLLM